MLVTNQQLAKLPELFVLSQPRVLHLGLLQDWNTSVGVFPECEKLLERLFRSRCIARKRVTSRHSQIGEGIELSPIWMVPVTGPIGSPVVRDLSELGRGFLSSAHSQVSEAPQIRSLKKSSLVR